MKWCLPIDLNRGELFGDEFMAKMMGKLKVVKYVSANHALFILKIKVNFNKKKEKGAKIQSNLNHWSLAVDNRQKMIFEK